MPAQLRLYTPNHPAIVAWIQSEVVRIGSGRLSSEDGVDIHIDGVAPHLATVIFRDGKYLLANRSDKPMRLGRRTVMQGEVAVWRDGVVLTINEGMRIELVCHGDPHPIRDEVWRALPDVDAPDRDRDSARQRRNEAWCFVIALVAIFLTAVFARRPTINAARIDCQRIVAAIDDLPEDERSQYQEIRGWILKGYSLEQRDEPGKARQLYLQARSLIAGLVPSQESSVVHEQVRTYLMVRITSD